MSLTSHLRIASSPVAKFFRKRFNTRKFIREITSSLAQYPLITSEASRKQGDASLIGTAIDYRIRYYFNITPFNRFVAYKAISEIGVLSKDLDVYAGTMQYFVLLHKFVQRQRIIKRKLPSHIENILNYHCLVLAKLEQLVRAGFRVFDTSKEFYLSFKWLILNTPEKGLKQLFCCFNDSLIKEMNNLSYLFYDKFNSSISHANKKILNPTFGLSVTVGGADADLIIGNTLIELKSTRKTITNLDVFQLIGYKLLDIEDDYKIKKIAIYFIRRGAFFQWDVEELIKKLSINLNNYHSLSKLKSDFYNLPEMKGYIKFHRKEGLPLSVRDELSSLNYLV